MRLLGRNMVGRLARRACAVVALVAYLVATVGFPVPARNTANESVAGPLRPCGCPSAGPRRHCCCSAGGGACCSNRAAHPAPCCAKRAAHQEQPAQPAPVGGVGWVPGLAALSCQGAGTLWIASGAVSVPPAPLVWAGHALPAGWLSPPSEHFVGLSLVPPDPPPRSAHS
jgi:hypothetical protein